MFVQADCGLNQPIRVHASREAVHPRNICIIKLPSGLVLMSELLDYRFGVGVVEGEESVTPCHFKVFSKLTKKTKEFLYVFTSAGLKKSVSQTDNILFFPDIVN